ncbi:hypothetical protein LXL04_020594 [Taraxacum kok-saghyz]
MKSSTNLWRLKNSDTSGIKQEQPALKILSMKDKKIKSLFNFIEGADPKLIYQAFQAGLIDNIYSSCNLQEIKHFPNSMIEAIKNFRKKVLKAKDDPIYIKVISSIPDWHHDIRFAPYHFLEIGLAKTN